MYFSAFPLLLVKNLEKNLDATICGTCGERGPAHGGPYARSSVAEVLLRDADPRPRWGAGGGRRTLRKLCIGIRTPCSLRARLRGPSGGTGNLSIIQVIFQRKYPGDRNYSVSTLGSALESKTSYNSVKKCLRHSTYSANTS